MKEYSLTGKIVSLWLFILPFVFSNGIIYISDGPKYFYVTFGVAILSLYYAYLVFKGKGVYLGKWLSVILLLALVSVYMSALSGFSFSNSFWPGTLRMNGVYLFTHLFFLVFILSQLFQKKDWQLAFKNIAISSVVFAFFSYLAPEGFGLLKTTGFTMANATFAGSFLLLGLLFNILWFIKEKRWIYGISALLIFFTPFILLNGLWRVGSIWSPGLFIGDARASSATAILVVIYILGLYLLRRFVNVRKATFVYSTIWIVLFSLAVAMLFVPGSFIRNKYIEQASAARVLVWDIGFEAFKDKPLLGWGPENFRFGFYKHFNPELMLRQNLNEVWFDRAHNVFIDTLVNVGAIGFIIFFILFAYAIFILYKVYKKGKIGFWEAEIIGVLLFAHVLQIQTSFNTITTYIILSFVLGYLLWLENGDSQIVDKKKVVAIVLVIFSLSSLYLNSREFTTQRSLIKLFTSSTNEEQVINIKKVSAKTHDFELIRISSASFISGFLTQLYKNGNQTVFDNGIGQIHLYEEWYKKYLKNIPNDYRANINYSYLLLTKSALGEDSIEEAKSLISRTYSLSPNNPTTYAIGAIAELYDGNLEKTLEIWSEGKNLNPKSPYVEKMGAYLLEQVNNFPDIDIARVENI